MLQAAVINKPELRGHGAGADVAEAFRFFDSDFLSHGSLYSQKLEGFSLGSFLDRSIWSGFGQVNFGQIAELQNPDLDIYPVASGN